jgi:hypothetical protein
MPNGGARSARGKLEWKGSREVPELRKSPDDILSPEE